MRHFCSLAYLIRLTLTVSVSLPSQQGRLQCPTTQPKYTVDVQISQAVGIDQLPGFNGELDVPWG